MRGRATPRLRRARPGAPVLAGAALAAVLFAGCAENPSVPAAVDEARSTVVAEVNGKPILARQLDEVLDAGELLALDGRGPVAAPGTEAQDPRRRALDLLISGELVHQAAKAAGLQVADEQIDEQISVARSQFATEDEFHAHLEAAGSGPDELRRQAERRLLMGAYVRSITAELDLDESRAREVYERQKDRYAEKEEVRVAHIIVRLLPGDPPGKRAAARRKIEQAHARAVAGESFEELAREFSESPFADRGGDLGYFPRGRALPEFEKVVFATPVGQISPVFETPHGLNVVRVTDRRQGEAGGFEQVKSGLLMVLARDQRDQALRQHVQELREQAEIRILDPTLVLTE